MTIRCSAIALVLCSFLLGACSMMAPEYAGSLENVQKLKSSGSSGVKVGAFGIAPSAGDPSTVSVRANSMHSPYEGTYNGYLSAAIRQDLTLAGLLKPASDTEVSGELLKNELNAGAISTATANMSARFIVRKAGVERYNEVKTIQYEWDSSFIGAVAIPRAQQAYPHVVEKLLGALYDDSAFLEALK